MEIVLGAQVLESLERSQSLGIGIICRTIFESLISTGLPSPQLSKYPLFTSVSLHSPVSFVSFLTQEFCWLRETV
jgi:hypothetical protein